MLVELVQLKESNQRYSLNKIYLNSSHIVYISENEKIKKIVSENKDQFGFVEGTTFSTIRVSDAGLMTEITVVGDPSTIESKIFNRNNRQVLRG